MKRIATATIAFFSVLLLTGCGTGCGSNYKAKDIVLIQPSGTPPYSGSVLKVSKRNGVFFYTVQPCIGGEPAEWPQSNVVRHITDISQEWKAVSEWKKAHTQPSPQSEHERLCATGRSYIFWYAFIPVVLIVLSWVCPQLGGGIFVIYFIVCFIVAPDVFIPTFFLTMVVSALYVTFVAFWCSPAYAVLSYIAWWVMFVVVG